MSLLVASSSNVWKYDFVSREYYCANFDAKGTSVGQQRASETGAGLSNDKYINKWKFRQWLVAHCAEGEIGPNRVMHYVKRC